MPSAVIAAIIAAAATATEVGVQVSGAGQPSTPKAAPATPAGPTAQQVTAAAAPQALSIESATGGSVSPDYLSTVAPILAGVAGQPNTNAGIQQVLQQILGKGGTSTPTLGSTTPNATPNFTPTGLPVNLSSLAATPGVSDFLSKIAGGIS